MLFFNEPKADVLIFQALTEIYAKRFRVFARNSFLLRGAQHGTGSDLPLIAIYIVSFELTRHYQPVCYQTFLSMKS